jgi:hypothetical protein
LEGIEMAPSGNVRLQLAGSQHTLTADAYDDKAVLGVERRYTLTERITGTGAGNFNSVLAVPAGVRLLIVGVSIDWAAAPGAAASISLGVTVAGNDMLGFPDLGYGSFKTVTPLSLISAAAPPGTIYMAHANEFSVVTVVGNAANPLFRSQIATAGTGTFGMTVYYAPLYAEDLRCS